MELTVAKLINFFRYINTHIYREKLIYIYLHINILYIDSITMPKNKKNPFEEAFLNTGHMLEQYKVFDFMTSKSVMLSCTYGIYGFPVFQSESVDKLSKKYFGKNDFPVHH
jgi:hypothetical protein